MVRVWMVLVVVVAAACEAGDVSTVGFVPPQAPDQGRIGPAREPDAQTEAETVPATVAQPDTAAPAPEVVVPDVPPAAPEVVQPAAEVAQPAADLPVAQPKGLVVHEWGTFTSVQASNGETLDGLHHEEEKLPGFVYARSSLVVGKGLEGLPEPCNQKMETPVVYFYTPEKLNVTLKVDFPQGVIGQWYPAASAFAPDMKAFEHIGSDILMAPGKKLSGGSMTWMVQVDPGLSDKLVPTVPLGSIWQPARNTDSALVHFVGTDHKNASVDQYEKFLFYRGLGRFVLPPKVIGKAGGALQLDNPSPEAIPYAVLLHSSTGDQGGVHVTALGMPAKSAVAEQVPALSMTKAAAIQAAKNALTAGIVQAGLHQYEAQAMVDTWQKSWFASPGVRLLYVLPAKWTEQLLPMQVTPKPAGIARVLVGRIEILTPEQEASDKLHVLKYGSNPGNLAKMLGGRFVEPRVRRACALIQSPPTQECATLTKWAENQP